MNGKFSIYFVLVLLVSCDSRNEYFNTLKLSELTTKTNVVVVRTDFSNEYVWKQLCQEIKKPSKEGFMPYVDFLQDEQFKDVVPIQLLEMLSADKNYDHSYFFVADALSMKHPQTPLMCVSMLQDLESTETFRVIPNMLWVVENNLSISNLLFEEFFYSLDADGILRNEGQD